MRNSILKHGLAVLAMLTLGACATMNDTGRTMDGKPAGATPPKTVKTMADVPANQSTYHYEILIYPGTGDQFNPDPKLTLTEFSDISKFDWYCAREVSRLEGQFKEMVKQGGTYGAFQGSLGAIGARLAFGNLIRPLEYLQYMGMSGVGGGLASGVITYEQTLNVAHGYCMTGMVYKADELEGKLRRIFIVPLYAGSAKRPAVSEAPAPTYGGKYLSPPIR